MAWWSDRISAAHPMIDISQLVWLTTVAAYRQEWAATETGMADMGTLAQYGAIGVICVALFIFARGAYRRETDRSDRLEQEVLRLNAVIQDKVIPALFSATGAVEESVELMREMQRDRRSGYGARARRDGDDG